MPSRRLIAVLSASTLAATAVIAACSGFSSEETAQAQAEAGATDAEIADAGATDATAIDDASSSPSDASEAATPRFCQTQDASYCYDFETETLPLEGWSFDGLSATGGKQILQRRIQILSEQSASGVNSLKVTATSGQALASRKIFLTRTFDVPASQFALAAQMYVSNRCNGLGCPSTATIAKLTLVSGRNLYCTLASDGKLGIEGDQIATVLSSAGSTLDAWKNASLALSAAGTLTVTVGSATVTAASVLSSDGGNDGISSLSLGVDSAEFSGGYGWVYYLDNLQITVTH